MPTPLLLTYLFVLLTVAVIVYGLIEFDNRGIAVGVVFMMCAAIALTFTPAFSTNAATSHDHPTEQGDPT